MKDIFERDLSGEPVSIYDKDYNKIKEVITHTKHLINELNTAPLTPELIREYFSKIIGVEVKDGFTLNPPFYTDFGKNIRVGKNVFINFGCTFMDRGGINIGDNVFIAPHVQLITENHLLERDKRMYISSSPINIGNNVWIGAGAIILPGVTIGENAVVGAGSVITKNVEKNTVVAGNPARTIKKI